MQPAERATCIARGPSRRAERAGSPGLRVEQKIGGRVRGPVINRRVPRPPRSEHSIAPTGSASGCCWLGARRCVSLSWACPPACCRLSQACRFVIGKEAMGRHVRRGQKKAPRIKRVVLLPSPTGCSIRLRRRRGPLTAAPPAAALPHATCPRGTGLIARRVEADGNGRHRITRPARRAGPRPGRRPSRRARPRRSDACCECRWSGRHSE